jgi:hypothetical protein
MSAFLTSLDLEELVKLEHSPFAASVTLAAFMEDRWERMVQTL